MNNNNNTQNTDANFAFDFFFVNYEVYELNRRNLIVVKHKNSV